MKKPEFLKSPMLKKVTAASLALTLTAGSGLMVLSCKRKRRNSRRAAKHANLHNLELKVL